MAGWVGFAAEVGFTVGGFSIGFNFLGVIGFVFWFSDIEAAAEAEADADVAKSFPSESFVVSS